MAFLTHLTFVSQLLALPALKKVVLHVVEFIFVRLLNHQLAFLDLNRTLKEKSLSFI